MEKNTFSKKVRDLNTGEIKIWMFGKGIKDKLDYATEKLTQLSSNSEITTYQDKIVFIELEIGKDPQITLK